MFWIFFFFFGHKAGRILAPWPKIKPLPPALEGRVPTPERPGGFIFKPT